ncbi:MAG: DUF2703 domain-containing protein [Thermoplasmata archaeon]|nr:DUF2703 domain-containing protein [Thermoplasmata archaeon]
MGCHCHGNQKEKGAERRQSTKDTPKKIVICWRRLVVEEKTCERCAATEKELDEAFSALKEALSHLGIEVQLVKETITPETFKRQPLSSNQILINGEPLESYLNANVGHSQCCGACGDEECRTLETEGERFEVIPSDLIIRATLLAAAETFDIPRNKRDYHIEGCYG